MKLSKQSWAFLALAFVALGYSLSSVAIHFLSGGFGPFTQVYLRIGIAFLLSLAVFGREIKVQKLLNISKKDWLLLILMGTVGYGLAVDCVTLGVLNTKLLNVAVMSSNVPIFTFIYSIFFLRKHTNKILFILITLSIYGVFVIATKSFIPSINSFGIGEFYSLLFAAGIGCYSICRRFISKNINSREITVIVIFFAFISSFLVAMFMGEKLSVVGFSKPIVLLGLLMGVFFNFINTHLENFSFQYIKPAIGTQLLLLENVFAPLLGFIIFHEKVTSIEFMGGLIIISCVILANKYSPSDN